MEIIHIAVLFSLLACALGHTVYSFPDKVPVPHTHQGSHYGHQPDYSTGGGHDVHHPHKAGNYHQEETKYEKQGEISIPYPYCQYNGDILKNPSDRCSYLECHYGDEPWYNKNDKAKLYARVRRCPQGTAVAEKAPKVLFRPIQYDPTKRVYKEHAGYEDNHYGYKGYRKRPSYVYKNTYEDMTAICSELDDGYSCKGY